MLSRHCNDLEQVVGIDEVNETWLNCETKYEGKIFDLKVGQAKLDDGTVAHREIVVHGGGVGVVPVLAKSVLLVRQFRIAVGKEILEIPAGRLEPGDSNETRALAELEEEVGYRAGRLVHVASCHCSPGFTSELDHIFLAFDLKKTEQNLGHDERVEIVELTFDHCKQMLDRCEFDDAKTIIGLRELFARGLA